MGIYDRDYNRANYSGRPAGPRLPLPVVTPVIKLLLIINFSVFVLSFLVKPLGELIDSSFAVSTHSVFQSLQLWRVITYQFLHADPGHIISNMLWLFLLGHILESLWGAKRFLIFYFVCGAMGGIVYPISYYAGFAGDEANYLVGASGAIFGVIVAVAIMFPHMRVYIMGVLPIPMYIIGAVMVMISAYTLLAGENVGGELAHFSGLGVGAIYVLWQPWLEKTRTKISKGRWEKKVAEDRELHLSVDQILEKVHKSGIKSLTRKEKKILKQATEKEQGR